MLFFGWIFRIYLGTFIHRLVHGAIFHGVLTTFIYTKTGWHEEKEEVLKSLDFDRHPIIECFGVSDIAAHTLQYGD